jgi:hypothetical protein
MGDDDSSEVEAPGLSSWLLSFLAMRRHEYEAQYALSGSEEEALDSALIAMERFAADLITSGVISPELGLQLMAFKPGDAVEYKIRELLTLQIVHHRLEFDIAEMAASKLDGLSSRVAASTTFTAFLLGYNPSPTAEKYFRRASMLFLAGYDAETLILCGAVLEAALTDRFPDELLAGANMKPVFRDAGFSLAQRLKYESAHPLFSDVERRMVRDVNSWRNQAVHVQPDLGPAPVQALLLLSLLLPKILPGEATP